MLYNGSVWVAVGEVGTIITSPDAQTWTLQPAISGVTGFLHGITLVPNGTADTGILGPVTDFLVCGANGVLLEAPPNGIGFTIALPDEGSPPTANLEAVLNVAAPSSSETQPIQELAVAVGQGTILHCNAAVGAGSVIGSNDFINSPSAIPNVDFRGLTYGNGYWVVAGEQGTILTSMDGINWTQQLSGSSQSTASTATLLGAAYSAALQRFVVVGTGGTILVSNVPPILPTITTEPVSETISLGASVTFSVSTTGTPSPAYQWFLNGTPINGATGSSLTITNAQLANEGTYTVVATNGAGSVTSSPATLIVNLPITYSTTTFATVAGSGPNGVAVDPSGNVYITVGNAVERVTSTGGISVVAGSLAASGSADGTGSAAQFNGPRGIATDSAGNIYVADTGNNSVRKVTPLGQVTTLAGLIQGNVNGVGVSAEFNGPTAVAVDGSGNVYVADIGNNELRKVTANGSTTTLLSGSSFAFDDISPQLRAEYSIMGVTVDSAGNPYIGVGVTIPVADFPVVKVSVLKVNSTGAYSQLFQVTDEFYLLSPEKGDGALAMDGSGNFYVLAGDVLSNGQNTISSFAVASLHQTVLPVAIAAFSNGGILVANPPTQALYIVAPIGSAPNIATQPVGATVAFGASASLSVLASGTPTPTYQWQVNGVNISGATSASYVTSTPGTYTVVVANAAGSVTSDPVVVTAATRLVNISTRAQVGTGANVEIAGFVVSGPPGSTEQLLVRGVGPTLSQSGVSGVLAQPVLTLYNSSGTILATNTGWGTNSNAAQIAATAVTVGAFTLPLDSADSALLVSLPPGAYTAEVTGLNNTTGVALAEAYEVTTGTTEMVNVSTRGFVSTGSSVEIAGIVVTGSQSAKVLVRAVGPTLSQFGVSGVLAQPTLSVVNSSGSTVATNAGWSTNSNAAMIASETAAVGTFGLPTGSADCALVLMLAPGSYTAVVSGVGGTSGVCLVEAYQAP